MSKNPAWNAYNEACRKANEEYESTVKPLRMQLSKNIAETETHFDMKINPLVLEKRQLVDGLRETFSNCIAKAENDRRTSSTRAHSILQTELKAAKEKAKEEAAA